MTDPETALRELPAKGSDTNLLRDMIAFSRLDGPRVVVLAVRHGRRARPARSRRTPPRWTGL